MLQAKLSKSGKLSASHRVTLKVDIHSGKLFMVRPSKETLDDSNVFNHDKGISNICPSIKYITDLLHSVAKSTQRNWGKNISCIIYDYYIVIE